jgi:hypothetical protein
MYYGGIREYIILPSSAADTPGQYASTHVPDYTVFTQKTTIPIFIAVKI